MHPVLARMPLIRRPFYQRDLALQQRDRALLERDAAIQERDALGLELAEQVKPSEVVSGESCEPPTLSRSCVFCNRQVDAWLPFHIRSSDVSSFLKRAGICGSNFERLWCPHCRSHDRERHLRLFLERLCVLERIRGGSVLHIAPEPTLGDYILSYAPSLYVLGDLNPGHESVQRIDLQQIPFPDETFDLVICNHILEHVEDAVAALREMHRVLRPGARAICQTPYATRLTKTLEDPLLQSTDDRLFFYGQADHVRLFGLDLEDLIRQVGFVGRLVPHAEILPDVDPELLGISEKEPFFDFVRGGRPAQLT